MLNTRPGPPNQVSVHPPLSQIRTGTETSIIRRMSNHGDYPTKPSSIPTSYHDCGLESVGTVSVVDVKTRTRAPTDIPVGPQPTGPAISPDGTTLFVPNYGNGTVSTIDVKNRTKDPADVPVGMGPTGASVTPCRR